MGIDVFFFSPGFEISDLMELGINRVEKTNKTARPTESIPQQNISYINTNKN